ncbi:PAS domain-containing protein [Sinisalibacter lacisalsi]|uniref:PAS domain-containing protein n=1 Tax=Sinisalibacter lacisalsi TaxID=1526570 RepID=A0ABQ1QMI6_9RHOB|nr:PAS domain-containing protein [Sinisalibacter lacisalsi]GGD32623.1 PAS domain-containing protein [Sinisalibacter lacisalsi]
MIDYVKDDKVISLTPMRRRALFPAIGVVDAYWEGLRDGRLMPTRSDVDPRGIAEVLEFAFILEKIAPGVARIRLAGLHLNEIMGMEVRGMPVTALFLPEARREIARVLETVLDEPAVVRLALNSQGSFSLAGLEAQMIFLPLRDESGRPMRILGALQARGEIGRGPRRFTIADIETKPLMADPLTARAPRPGPPVDRAPQGAGIGDDARPSSPHTEALRRQIAEIRRASEDGDRRASHLRLVHNTAED